MQLSLEDVGHRFDQQPWLFQHLTLPLDAGQVYALTGPSGSGKSTLLGILAGWISPIQGHITVSEPLRAHWVFQSPHGVARRSVIDHCALPLLAAGQSRTTAHAQARRLLDTFGLGQRTDARYHELSGGEAQRLMLARAMATDATLLLVDEPTASLDPATGRSVAATIAALADPHRIVVVATHDQHTRDACTRHIDLAQWRDDTQVPA